MKTDSVYLSNTPLGEARKLWRQALESCGFFSTKPVRIAVDQALGETTAVPVYARHSSPSYNASAMDGVAVRFQDLSMASEASPVTLPRNNYLPVNTGNAIPEPYNAVVMIEDVHQLDDDAIELISPATPWQHVRTVGEDIVATEMIIPEGHVIRPIDQGALLAAGITEVKVCAKPVVTVLPTGSELIQPGSEVCPGQIIEFNSRILSGYLLQWGAKVIVHPPVSDDPDELAEAFTSASRNSDIIFTIAGASAGTRDFSGSVLGNTGKIIIHGVAIKPGKPVILALIGDTPVVGLPGYPISALLTMHLFGRELVYGFSGKPLPEQEFCEAIMSRPMHSAMGVDQFVRVTLGQVGDKLIATPSGKGAGSVMSMVRADGLLTIPSGSEGIGAGQPIRIEMLRSKREVDRTLVAIGSHDNILDLMANFLHRLDPPLRLSSAHVGSMGGIMAIRRGEAHFGGTHLLDEETGEYNVSFIKRFLPDTPLKLINLCYREQGFIVPRGNPNGIGSFTDIIDQKLSFINRQKGAGTRLLTDKVLRDSGLEPDQVPGYNHEEYTHMNVAAAILSGSADVGMGIRAAAVALDLDFVPIAEERYDLIVPSEFLDDIRLKAVMELMNQDSFKKKIDTLGGYNLRDCGSEVFTQ
ncbi:MAG: molybdopterin biosynthesis protein [Desulfobulbaceae bacterium]|nr:MAG: molybdopterin biosynthesis protein [Desulfobulbaceae bacterium]